MKKKASDIFRELENISSGAFIGVVAFIFVVDSFKDPLSVVWMPILFICLSAVFSFVRRVFLKKEKLGSI